MLLTPGARLGPSSVVPKVGEGGMGEIDRARDTRLDRDVALVMEFVERETTGRHTRLVRVTDIEPLRRGSHTGKAGPP